jgi:hypothetical protein
MTSPRRGLVIVSPKTKRRLKLERAFGHAGHRGHRGEPRPRFSCATPSSGHEMPAINSLVFSVTSVAVLRFSIT